MPLRGHCDSAIVELDQLLHQRQPDPQAAMSPAIGSVRLAKHFEDVRDKSRIDALSSIFDTEYALVCVATQAHRHSAHRQA